MAVVVDASVAMGWLVQSQATPLTEAAKREIVERPGLVPAHFGLEILRALRRRERRNVLTAGEVDFGLRRLQALGLRQDDSHVLNLAERIVALARSQKLRVSDAAYLELALRTGHALATQDVALARAAIATGARLFTG
jgi:predicted nucleic acid-binding protein